MRSAVFLLALCLCACGSSSKNPQDPGLPIVSVTLPNGKVIRAELASNPGDQQRGLMFRTELPPDRGMLFVFPRPDQHPFWMYQTLIPLDVIWMDASRRVVFISAHTPPCPAEQGQNCPNYGGEQVAQFVLELAAGAAAANGLKPGDTLRF